MVCMCMCKPTLLFQICRDVHAVQLFVQVVVPQPGGHGGTLPPHAELPARLAPHSALVSFDAAVVGTVLGLVVVAAWLYW